MTLRVVMNHDKVASYTILDNASPPGPTPLTPLVLDNLALLRLVPILDKVEGVGVRLSPAVYVVCQLPVEYNPPLDTVMLYIKALS